MTRNLRAEEAEVSLSGPIAHASSIHLDPAFVCYSKSDLLLDIVSKPPSLDLLSLKLSTQKSTSNTCCTHR